MRAQVTTARRVAAGLALSALVLTTALSASSSDPVSTDTVDHTASQKAQKATRAAQRGPQPHKAYLGMRGTSRHAGAPVKAKRATRPNVLLVVADDASVSDLEHMPYTRRLLAAKGTTFDQAVATTPICVPARASLATGQHAHNHGAHTISGPAGGFKSFDDGNTLPVWLEDAGYRTMFVGKYLNGYGKGATERYVPPGWTDWRAAGRGTYNFLRTNLNINGRVVRYNGFYNSEVFTAHMVDMIHSHARLSNAAVQAKPFYMWVNYVAPHHGGPKNVNDKRPKSLRKNFKPPYVHPKHLGTKKGVQLPAADNLFAVNDGTKSHRSTPYKAWGAKQVAAATSAHQKRLESLQSVDEGVRAAVRALKATGQLSNTVIVYTSDNGYLLGNHSKWGKLMSYNESLTVPMVARGPGIPARHREATIVTLTDLATTIAGIAKVTPGRAQDGQDFRPWLRGDRPVDRAVPIRAWPVKWGLDSTYTGVRTSRYTYVEFRDKVELYDRLADPFELRNVALDPEYTFVRMQLAAAHDRLADCIGSQCHSLAPGVTPALR